MKSDSSWKAILGNLPAVLDQKLKMVSQALDQENYENFKRNKGTLEFLGILQKADDNHDNTSGAMKTKTGFAHHEAANELLK